MNVTNRTTVADIQCVLLGLGFSYTLIRQRTGLTNGQIALRLKQTKSQVKLYRLGESRIAERVIEASTADTKRLLNEIRAEMKQLAAPV